MKLIKQSFSINNEFGNLKEIFINIDYFSLFLAPTKTLLYWTLYLLIIWFFFKLRFQIKWLYWFCSTTCIRNVITVEWYFFFEILLYNIFQQVCLRQEILCLTDMTRSSLIITRCWQVFPLVAHLNANEILIAMVIP